METMSNLPVKKKKIDALTTENWEHRTHTSINKDTGLYETHDVLTGELLRVQSELIGHYDLSEFSEVNLDGKTVMVQRGIDFSRLSSRKLHVYSREVIDIICSRITQGESLTSILKDKAMPSSSTLSIWRKNNAEIDEALSFAYEMRAEHHRDIVKDVADEKAVSKLDLANQNKRIDAHKWLASKDAPKRFGAKKEEHDPIHPVYVISTGIVREEKDVTEIKDVIDVGSEE